MNEDHAEIVLAGLAAASTDKDRHAAIAALKEIRAEARQCPACGAEDGTTHMDCQLCHLRSRAETAEAQGAILAKDLAGARESLLFAADIAERFQTQRDAAEAEVVRLREALETDRSCKR